VRQRFLAPIVVLVALATTITACSSSGTKSGGSGGATGAATGGSSSAAAGGGGGSSGVAAAKAEVAKWSKTPTTIPQTTPLKSKPPTGKTFVFLKCADVNQCADEAAGFKAATAAIGWNYKEISFKSADPATLVSAFKQALQYNPVAVASSGLPRAVWESVVPLYRAKKVKIVDMYIGATTYDDTVIGQVGGPKDVNEYGQIIANWVVADSNGKANILLQEVNDFPILKDYVTGFKQVVQKDCPSCKITELNNTIAQLGGQIVPAVVAALQKDRSINYVSTVNGPFLTGLPAALAAAGLTKVKICGESGDVQNLTNVKSGKEGAYTGLALHHASFLAMDMVLRNMEGMSYDKEGDGGAPKQLLTKDVDFKIQNSFDVPPDYANQFKKLWLVG
jgi:ribose transport system substrate-binding protein